MADVVQHADLPSQRDFEILESLRLLVRIASGLHHRLMRVLDRIDVFVETFLQHFRLAGFYRVTGKAQQDFGNVDIGFRAIDGIGESDLVCLFLFGGVRGVYRLDLGGAVRIAQELRATTISIRRSRFE